MYNAIVAYVNLVIIAVHGLSDNSVRSVYLGYIYPMNCMVLASAFI